MRINADFQARAAVHFDEAPWVPSPSVGVERRMLDLVGEEVARATSIVRYAAGSRFPSHVHGGGEEFLVLDGVFSDEGGDMPRGTYVRNPPGTSHAPSSAQGCTLFVKLWQFEPDDHERVRIDIGTLDLTDERRRPGISSATLFERGVERTRVERWESGATVALALPHGGEFLVLEGSFSDGLDVFSRASWLRLLAGAHLAAQCGRKGCKLWVKTGHLPPA